MTVLQKAIAILAAIVILAVVVSLGIRQYGNARVAESRQEHVENVLSEAVAARSSAVKVDVAQSTVRAAKAQEVRAAVISHRETLGKGISHYETACDPAADGERLRVLLSAAAEVNRIVESAAGVPDEL